jgi:hypothetical protein
MALQGEPGQVPGGGVARRRIPPTSSKFQWKQANFSKFILTRRGAPETPWEWSRGVHSALYHSLTVTFCWTFNNLGFTHFVFCQTMFSSVWILSLESIPTNLSRNCLKDDSCHKLLFPQKQLALNVIICGRLICVACKNLFNMKCSLTSDVSVCDVVTFYCLTNSVP